MYKRILPAFVAVLAFVCSASADEARKPQAETGDTQVEANEPEWWESEAELLALGEFTPFIDSATRSDLWNRGMLAKNLDNVSWQSYCSYMYGKMLNKVDIDWLNAAYRTCNDIASSEPQTKSNWVAQYFAP
jgi:hypothetical protein